MKSQIRVLTILAGTFASVFSLSMASAATGRVLVKKTHDVVYASGKDSYVCAVYADGVVISRSIGNVVINHERALTISNEVNAMIDQASTVAATTSTTTGDPNGESISFAAYTEAASSTPVVLYSHDHLTGTTTQLIDSSASRLMKIANTVCQ